MPEDFARVQQVASLCYFRFLLDATCLKRVICHIRLTTYCTQLKIHMVYLMRLVSKLHGQIPRNICKVDLLLGYDQKQVETGFKPPLKMNKPKQTMCGSQAYTMS